MITAVSYGYSSFTGTFSLPGAIGLDAGGFLFPTQDETVKEKKAIAEKKESQDLESRLRPAYDGLALIAARSAEESENIPVSSLNIHSNYLVPLFHCIRWHLKLLLSITLTLDMVLLLRHI